MKRAIQDTGMWLRLPFNHPSGVVGQWSAVGFAATPRHIFQYENPAVRAGKAVCLELRGAVRGRLEANLNG